MTNFNLLNAALNPVCTSLALFGAQHILHASRQRFKNLSSIFIPVYGKAALLQVWNGPEVSNYLRFPFLVTTAQDGGKVVSLTHRPPLPPGNKPGTHFC
jgi:hypothetical protein